MSSKRPQQPPKRGRPPAKHQLVVWGEPRKGPDWDIFVAALLAYALREVGVTPEPRKDDRG